MFFSRPLIVESALAASASRERVRMFATSRDMPQLEAFRRRQIIGWRLSEANEDFVFQPEYGDSLDVEGARFVGLVEPVGSGSRIRGLIVVSLLTRVVMSILVLIVLAAAIAALGQGKEPATKVLAVASTMVAAAVIMVRYSLRSTSQLVAARLRQCLEASEPSVAA